MCLGSLFKGKREHWFRWSFFLDNNSRYIHEKVIGFLEMSCLLEEKWWLFKTLLLSSDGQVLSAVKKKKWAKIVLCKLWNFFLSSIDTWERSLLGTVIFILEKYGACSKTCFSTVMDVFCALLNKLGKLMGGKCSIIFTKVQLTICFYFGLNVWCILQGNKTTRLHSAA